MQLLWIHLWFCAHRIKLHQHGQSAWNIYSARFNVSENELNKFIMSGFYLLSVTWDLSRWCAKINAKHLHASDDSQSRLQDVAKDDRSELHLFLYCVTTLMQNPASRRVGQKCFNSGKSFLNNNYFNWADGQKENSREGEGATLWCLSDLTLVSLPKFNQVHKRSADELVSGCLPC